MKLKYTKCKPYFLKKLYSTNVEVLCQTAIEVLNAYFSFCTYCMNL